MNRLQVTGLSKTYANGFQALNDVSLDISNGIFGLLGPNGAGKSSFMRTLATLQAPSNGEVLFNGVDIMTNPQYMRAQLGYLPQDFGVYPRMSAFDLLQHLAILKGLHQSKARTAQINSLLHHTNLYEVRHKAVATFSGGMKQRFGVAQALLGDPKLIIVDEPTAGLDPSERNKFHFLLSEIGEQVIVILSTHIVHDVKELCPQMAILAGGKLVAQGAPRHLLANLQGRTFSKLIPKDQLQQHQAMFPIVSSRLKSGMIEIHVIADYLPGDGFALVEADLEDLYFQTLRDHQTAEV
ncbi:ABC-type multidrug transport system ATPase subunit [Chitinophaga skermanii]|uniref:ABC-type multidrug transport system ATPase subunit n=1 Tax=Chitinophaga skermanii TaxID=331697 RepID=A0A327R3Q2_9BACT|nr:ABC transporter ATP-binding protein [Chitinophaga skermanii]RAJ08507.1 ABC-type multidrug transport system ATPase subunit [Chitinophaga skermanii]